MKSVLLLTPFYHPNIGGVETHLTDLVKELDSKKIKVYVHTYSPLTTKTNYVSHEIKGNIEIYRYKWIGHNLFHILEKFPLLDFLYLTPYLLIRTLLWLFKNHSKISTIHAHGLNAGLIGLILKSIFHKKLVVSFHALYDIPENGIAAKLSSYIANKSDSILTLSKASYNQLVRFGIKTDKLRVFRYWIDTEKFTPTPKLPNFTVLFVGRLIEKKGVMLLVDIAESLKDINFQFIGTGPLESSLSNLSKKFPNIKFLGPIPNEKLSEFYSKAHVTCVPSLYQEGFGRVVMESLSCGTPVIASKLAGLKEALDENVGILISPNTNSFKRSILKFRNDSNLYNQTQKNCRKYALKYYSSKNASFIINHY